MIATQFSSGMVIQKMIIKKKQEELSEAAANTPLGRTIG